MSFLTIINRSQEYATSYLDPICFINAHNVELQSFGTIQTLWQVEPTAFGHSESLQI